MPEVSIIVLCHDRWGDTRRCLESVKRRTDPALYELLAYDNASTDATASCLRRLAKGWPQLRVGHNGTNLSFAAANNRGMREANGRHLLWLNNDTVVTPGWLEGLLSAVRSSGSVAAAGPMTDHQAPPGQLARPFATRSAGRVADAPFLGGFCLLLSREALERVGPLDERFLWGWEDMDYCMRLRQAGRRLVIARDVFVAHAGSRTLDLLPSAERQRQDRANRSLMLGNWLGSPARRDLEDLYAALPSPWQRLTPRVSILLACRAWTRAKGCLESLRRSGGLEECELLAVDASGEPRLTRRLESAGKGWPAYRVLGPSAAASLAAALNRAAALAAGDHLAVFDDRARFQPGWLAALLRAARARPDAGAVRPALDARAGWLAPKDIFRRAGTFDEHFRGRACSADLLLRVLQAGRPILDAEGCRISLAAEAGQSRDVELADRRLALEKWGELPASATPRLAKELGAAPELSIIVLCRGAWKQARRRLEAARRAAGAADYELLAVPLDVPSGAWPRLQELADRLPRLRLLEPCPDRSPAAALNRAASRAHGERLALMAQDAPTLLLTSRADFQRLGGLDERFPGFGCLGDYRLRAGPRPEASVIVLCRGPWERTRRRLAALQRAAGATNCEVLAAYLGPSRVGARLAKLAGRWPRLRALGAWRDRSLAGAFNRAAAHARADRLVFLDDQADPAAGWLHGLLREARRKPLAGVVRPAAALMGFATPRALFERLGGFDERFAGALCGWDYWLRALQAGAGLVDAPGSRLLPRAALSTSAPKDRRLAIEKWLASRRSTPNLLWKDAGLTSAVSVILLCRGGWPAAKARLEAVRRALRGETGYEVLAGAFAAPPETSRGLRALAERWPRLRFVGSWPKTPYAHALNLASEAALGDLLLFLTDEAAVRPGFLGPLLAAASKAGGPAVVTPGRSTPRQLAEHCVLIHRDAFSSLGGFDRRFEHDLWARDFRLRALQGGYASGAVDPDVAPRLSGDDGAPSAHDRGLFSGKWSGHPLFRDEALGPAVSLVLLCRRGWEAARARLQKLRRALGSEIDYEVLAGAFAAGPETARGLRALAKRWPRLRFVGEWPPTPYAHALNLASESALGDDLLFLDDDAEVEPGFLEALLAAASKAERLAVVAPGRATPRELQEQCVLIPRRIFSSLGGFDRRFERELWARDFCLRALQGGFGMGSVDGSLARRRSNGGTGSAAHDRGLLFGKWSGHPLFEGAR